MDFYLQSVRQILCLTLLAAMAGFRVQVPASLAAADSRFDMALPAQPIRKHGKCQDASVVPNTSSGDHLRVSHAGNTIVVDVHHVTGIGGALLNPPTAGWPAVVIIRLHDFPDLESFSVHASVTLTCERMRPPGVPPRLHCSLGDANVQTILITPGYYEISLPAELLKSGIPVDIRWVDQWR